MLARDIMVGDELREYASGTLVYEVTSTRTAEGDERANIYSGTPGAVIIADVRYRDGGNGTRAWLAHTEVPLTRP